jgi:hypothetical protein
MITNQRGAAASRDIERWANGIIVRIDPEVEASVYYDGDSSTYVLRLARESRVLVFRLSEAQVKTAKREEECEKVLKRKISDLRTALIG